MKFFKPEDFVSGPGLAEWHHFASDQANNKLEREGKVVEMDSGYIGCVSPGTKIPTHLTASYKAKAILICIEPIKQCDHPKEKVQWWVRPDLYDKREDGYIGQLGAKCECGAMVEVEKFKAVE